MYGLRRSLSRLAPAARSLRKPTVSPMVSQTRRMVTLEQKEQGEEAAYIRRMENERAEARKAKMEAILARHESDEEKQRLLGIVDDEKPVVNEREIGFFQYLGLDDWKIALPVAMCFLPPLIHHQVIIVDYKFYLVGAFCVMWHAYDAVVIPIWSEKTDWIREDITSFWKKVDDHAVEELDQSIKSNEEFLESRAYFEEMFKAVDVISETRAVAMNKANKNYVHQSVQKKLDALVSLNEATNAAIRADMTESIKAEVLKNLSQSKVKESALNQAIANLGAGVSSPRGKDIVGQEYAKAIANYKAGLSAKDHRVHDITAKLESEIAEICKPIDVPEKAGNVYETHPVV